MHNEQNWRNRVELSLDNRQVFLLFFASAVVIGLVFALGVVVGKRYQPEELMAGASSDPLAMLDQLGQDPQEDELTFHETLSSGKAKPAAQARRPAEEPDPLEPVDQPDAESPAAAPKAPAPPKPAPAAAPPARPAAPAVIKDSGKKTMAKAAKVAAPEAKQGASSYTLQLSSFQERAEADRFMEKLKAAGLSPYLTPANIPGRGVWYRVRLGDYASWEKALEAKQEFERAQQIIAYVMKR